MEKRSGTYSNGYLECDDFGHGIELVYDDSVDLYALIVLETHEIVSAWGPLEEVPSLTAKEVIPTKKG